MSDQNETPSEATLVARIGPDDCVALKACISTAESRPILNYVLLREGIAEATNGHILVRVELRTPEREPVTKEHPRWMLHGDALSLVRGKNGALEIDLTTGKVNVLGKGGSYPISIPGAVTEDDVGTFPDTDKVVPQPNGSHRLVALGAGILKRLAAIAGKDGKIRFWIPEHGDEGHVQAGILIETHQGEPDRHGVVMPMRILD